MLRDSEGLGGAPIYLDHNASTPLDPLVLEAMMPFLTTAYGNPHSHDHSFGWRADAAVEEARARIATSIGADPDEVFFTSGATEANNLAILGSAARLPGTRRRILISAVEHKCVIEAARHACHLYDLSFGTIPVTPCGQIDLEAARSLIDESVGLLSAMYVNNEIGTVQPVAQLAAICEEAGVLFHTDAAQAMCSEPIDVVDLGVDFLSLSAHKAYGPMGIGALFIRRGAQRPQAIVQGGGQEGGLRSGTVPVPLCVGFGVAAELAGTRRLQDRDALLHKRGQLLDRLRTVYPTLHVLGSLEHRHPGNLNVRFPGVEADRIVASLQPMVAVSTGSACTTGQPEPSHVITAIGLTAEQARECIRLCVGRSTTDEDIERAGRAFEAAVRNIRVPV